MRTIVILIIDNLWSHWQSNQNTKSQTVKKLGEVTFSGLHDKIRNVNFDTYTKSYGDSSI